MKKLPLIGKVLLGTLLIMNLPVNLIKENFIMAKTHDNNSDVSIPKNNKTGLYSSESWKNIKNLWMTISEISNSFGKPPLRLFPQELMKRYGDYKNKLNDYFSDLINKKLLTANEKEFLQRLIDLRSMHVMQKSGMATCYISAEVTPERKTLDDLEIRYKLLHTLYEENKISTEAFKEARDKIVEDIAILQQKTTSPDNSIKKNSTYQDLIMELNK